MSRPSSKTVTPSSKISRPSSKTVTPSSKKSRANSKTVNLSSKSQEQVQNFCININTSNFN